MARENNIDLSKVKGTGAGGRITKQDVEAYMAQGPAPAAPAARLPDACRRAAARGRRAPAPSTPTAPLPAPGGAPKTRIEPMSQMRIKIAEHMVMSKRTSPHVTTVHRVDMTKVAKLRERNKETVQANYGFGLTYLPFITRAVGGSAAPLPAAQCLASTATTSSITTISTSASRWRWRTA